MVRSSAYIMGRGEVLEEGRTLSSRVYLGTQGQKDPRCWADLWDEKRGPSWRQGKVSPSRA